VTGPRNPRVVARRLRERAEIRRVWLELVQQQPFERATAKDIAKRLPFKLARSTIYWHMQRIGLEARLESMADGRVLDSVQCIE
jgi:AcrR family transcriptional regulator